MQNKKKDRKRQKNCYTCHGKVRILVGVDRHNVTSQKCTRTEVLSGIGIDAAIGECY